MAHRLRQPVILGYLAIGVVMGPHALGVITDLAVVEAAATIGVALLMFTLGLEVSFDQLRRVGRVGLWGGLAQIVGTILVGLVVGRFAFGWPFGQSVVFGMAISLSSTAVCFKMLLEQGTINSVYGRIMVAILILQDIAVVVMMVLMPALGGSGQGIFIDLGRAAALAVLFIGAAVVLGVWVLPWLMSRLAGVRSRELFLLTILVMSLGAAIASQLYGLSAVFGAFLVGLVIRETRFAHQALAEVIPLRDMFASLFFVSLGMLLDVNFVLANWQMVLSATGVVILVKLVVVFSVVRLFGHSTRVSILSALGLFQIGEFSFILAQDALGRGIVSDEFYAVLLGAAIITMLITPAALSGALRLFSRRATVAKTPSEVSEEKLPRVIIAGYGRMGENMARGLKEAGISFICVELDPERVAVAHRQGVPCIYGDASNINILSQVGLKKAGLLVLALPDPIAVVTAAKVARVLNPRIAIVARVEGAREAAELSELGVTSLVNPEYEASLELLRRTLMLAKLPQTEVEALVYRLRETERLEEFEPQDG